LHSLYIETPVIAVYACMLSVVSEFFFVRVQLDYILPVVWFCIESWSGNFFCKLHALL